MVRLFQISSLLSEQGDRLILARHFLPLCPSVSTGDEDPAVTRVEGDLWDRSSANP